ncbi:MAG: ABC transporter permease subunit [Oscillospiraceae bacterium]
MKSRLNSRHSQRARSFRLFTLLLPAMILLFVFYYLPLYGIVISFQDYSPWLGVTKSPWVGIKHYVRFLTDPVFWNVLKNTLVISFWDIAIGFTAPILFAICVSEIANRKFKVVVQTISYLPNFLSWIIVSTLFFQIFSPYASGLANRLFGLFGIEPLTYLSNPAFFKPMVVMADVWKNVGWSAILYFATMAGIDQSLYEAAYIDGAGRIKQIIHITLPGMAPIISLQFLLKLSNIFNVGFDRVFLLSNPAIGSSGDVISTYIYRVGLTQSQFSLTTAIGLVQSLIGFTILVVANKASKRITGLGLY